MVNSNDLDLQLFAGEGAPGDGGGETGNSAGESIPDAGEKRLLELGVPADKLRKRTKSTQPDRRGARRPAPAGNMGAPQAASDKNGRLTWEEIMEDPEYNRRMQGIVQARLKDTRSAGEALEKLRPAIAAIAERYGLDPENPDYDALSRAVLSKDSAAPMENAAGAENTNAPPAREDKKEDLARHFTELYRQGQELKRTFPAFDLETEMKNPVFAKMTSPGVGVRVEDAYFAVHRGQLQSAAMQVTAQAAEKKLANYIRSGYRRPEEAGARGAAPSVTSFDYTKLSREQREELKRRIHEAHARNEKIYPGE